MDSTPLYGFLQLSSEDDIKGVERIFDIYVERTKIVWKNNSVVLWVKAALGFFLAELETREKETKWQYKDFIQ